MAAKGKILKICDWVIDWGFLAIVFLTPLILDFTASTYNLFDLYKAVFFRSAMSLIILAYLAKIFFEGKISFRGGKKILLLAGLLLLSIFLSAVFSSDPDRSVWGDFLRQQGFYNYFYYFLFFVLLVLNLDAARAERLALAAVISASLSAGYGLIQFFGLDPMRWTVSTNGRVFSTLGQPNFFGHFLAMVLPLSLYFSLFWAKKFLTRFFLFLAVLAQFVCLVFTYSRAAWLGFLGSFMFLLLVWLALRGRKKAVLAAAGLMILALSAILSLNIFLKPARVSVYQFGVVDRVKSIVDFTGGSNRMRLYYLASAVAEVKRENPLRLAFGYGPDNLSGVLMKYYRPDWGVYEAINSFPDRTHNWLFDQILTFGFLGLTATLSFYGYLIYRAVGYFRARGEIKRPDWLLLFAGTGLSAYFINNLFSFSLFTNQVYLFLLLGFVWVLLNRGSQEQSVEVRLTAYSKVFIWLAVAVVFGIFFYTNNINQARAERHYVKAISAMIKNDCSGVVSNSAKTLEFSPNSVYYRQNYLYMASNCLPLIKNAAARARLANDLAAEIASIGEGDKDYYDLKINAARANSLLGFYLTDDSYYGKADKIFSEIISTYPYLTAAYEYWGRQKLQRNDYAGAADLFKRGLAAMPPLDHPGLNLEHKRQIQTEAVKFDEYLGQADLKLRNYDQATAYFRRAIMIDPFRSTSYKGLADSYYLRGDLKKAISINRRGLSLNPSDFHWHLSLSLLYRESGDLKLAKEYLNQALKLAPEDESLKKYYQELNK